MRSAWTEDLLSFARIPPALYPRSTSRVARSPDCNAASMFPQKNVLVSVPEKCTRPIRLSNR